MKFKDARITRLIAALQARFPGTTIVAGPMADAPYSGETHIRVLNAPAAPREIVREVANRLIDELWGDDWLTVDVSGVSPENTAKYYAHHVQRPRAARVRSRPARRRRPASPAR